MKKEFEKISETFVGRSFQPPESIASVVRHRRSWAEEPLWRVTRVFLGQLADELHIIRLCHPRGSPATTKVTICKVQPRPGPDWRTWVSAPKSGVHWRGGCVQKVSQLKRRLAHSVKDGSGSPPWMLTTSSRSPTLMWPFPPIVLAVNSTLKATTVQHAQMWCWAATGSFMSQQPVRARFRHRIPECNRHAQIRRGGCFCSSMEPGW